MMLLFQKDQEVCVKEQKFCDLLIALSLTVTNHLEYVDGATTQEQWNDLKCNGIENRDNLSALSVGRMLNMTEPDEMHIGTVIPELFRTIPILRHYWSITKLNQKSVWVKRLTPIKMSTFLENLNKKKPADLKQTTLSQYDIVMENSAKAPGETTDSTSPSGKAEVQLDTVVNDDDDFVVAKTQFLQQLLHLHLHKARLHRMHLVC